MEPWMVGVTLGTSRPRTPYDTLTGEKLAYDIRGLESDGHTLIFYNRKISEHLPVGLEMQFTTTPVGPIGEPFEHRGVYKVGQLAKKWNRFTDELDKELANQRIKTKEFANIRFCQEPPKAAYKIVQELIDKYFTKLEKAQIQVPA